MGLAPFSKIIKIKFSLLIQMLGERELESLMVSSLTVKPDDVVNSSVTWYSYNTVDESFFRGPRLTLL